MATFAQPPIIGLAYNYRLELFITNAADQEFRQQCQSNMILYSNQPNSSVIFKNLEHYENEFAKEFIINNQQQVGDTSKSSRSLSVPNASTPSTKIKLSPTVETSSETKKMNIETYLLSIIKAGHFSDRMNTSGGRLSSTTASESDECELFSIQSSLGNTATAALLKRLSSVGSDEVSSILGDDNNNNNGNDAFNTFLKFNTPFKNNFVNNRQLTPDTVETSFVWHMGFGGNSDDGVLHNYDYIIKENGSNEEDDDDDDDITDFENNSNPFNKASLVVKSYIEDGGSGGDDSFEKKLDNLTLGDKENNNSEDDLEKFNSHQYWYIEPPNMDAELNNLIDQNELNNNSINEEEVTAHNQSTIIMDDDETESVDSMKVSKASEKMELMNETPPEVMVPQSDENQPEEIEWTLIEDFVYMKDIDNTLCFKCAYNFPAVLLTLGRKFWPLLHQHFLSLCNDLQSKVRVRKTMAKSIYQVALIIGSEQATKDLVAPFVEFFKDIDEIKIEVVRQVSNFIKIVDPSKHELIINQLELCWLPTINVINWRLREQVGVQIVELNKFVQRIQKENCVLYLTGLALKLMMDKYDSVRKVGIDAVSGDFFEIFKS
jgi:hypothetical protein